MRRFNYEKIDSDINDAYDKAAEKAQKIEDEAFAKLNERSEARVSLCMEELNSQTKQLAALVDSKSEDFRNTIMEKTSSLDDEFQLKADELSRKLSEMSDDFENRLLSLDTKLSENSEALDGRITSKIESLEQSVEEQISSIEGC